MSQKCGKSFVVGAVLGGIAAGVTALLLAPKKGKEMRREIKKKYGECSDKTCEWIEGISDRAADLVEKAGDIASETRDAANSLIKQIRKR